MSDYFSGFVLVGWCVIAIGQGHDGPVMSMACHASGGLLATAGADRKVLVWDVDGGFCTHYFKGHKDVVTSIMFHPDTNKTLVTSMQLMTTLLTQS